MRSTRVLIVLNFKQPDLTKNLHMPNTTHFHAGGLLSKGNAYGYDSYGNMTGRLVYEGGTWKNYTLSL